MTQHRAILWLSVFGAALCLLPSRAFAQSRTNLGNFVNCEAPFSLCQDRFDHQSHDPEYKGRYIGHDEPRLLFYSDVPGSGNNANYKFILPKDPAKYPTEANPQGTGGPTVWNFQLTPFFWMGMALCDTEAYPEFTRTCTPDTDDNIFDDPDPNSNKYIGHHPGSAVLEVFLYPPGYWSQGSATQYAAVLGVGNYQVKDPGGILNNTACQNLGFGAGSLNFAVITVDGVSQAPADPLNNDPNKYATIPGKTFLMNPGDHLAVKIQDTPDGVQVIIRDLTTQQTGSMTASVANGFAHIVFDPSATTCTSRPYAFHPMYSTSSEHTRVPWAASRINIGFSEEIGHFNYCDTQDNSSQPGIGVCLSSPVENVFDPATGLHEVDDQFCVDGASSVALGFGNPPLGGCIDADSDFDGVPYHHAWPGSGSDPYGFSAVPEPVRLTSPKYRPTGAREDDLRSYDRMAFETDLPNIEAACNLDTGAGCFNPPPGALFYPIFTTTMREAGCWWQFGGPSIPGTTNTFGGSSVTEYGALERLWFIGISGPINVISNFYEGLPNNPCVSQ